MSSGTMYGASMTAIPVMLIAQTTLCHHHPYGLVPCMIQGLSVEKETVESYNVLCNMNRKTPSTSFVQVLR